VCGDGLRKAGVLRLARGAVRDPAQIGPELLTNEFVTWYEHRSIEQRYVQLGKPDQNAFIERFNRSYSEEVLNAYVFADLTEVRQISWNGGMAQALQRGATP